MIYERTVRVRPYETVKIGLWEEFSGAQTHEAQFQGVKAQVDKWIEEALQELSKDE